MSVTTRAPRPGETDGVEYHFITREEFDRLAKSDGLLEHAEYSGNCYGTPRAAVERHISEGRDVVLEIEVQGAMKIRESFPEAVFVFILPPSYGTLHERLAGRGTETPEAMEARLRTARFELSHGRGIRLCDRQRRCGKGARTVGRDHHGGQVPHPQYEKIYR